MLMRASTLSIAHETAGAARTRHSLHPLIDEGHVMAKTRAHRAAGMRNHIPPPSFRGAPSWREPGIHTPDRGYGFRARSASLRAPEWRRRGLRQAARPGM